MRRAWLYFELEAFERALQDATAATEADPGSLNGFSAGPRCWPRKESSIWPWLISIGHCNWTRITFDSLFIRAMVYRDRPNPQDQILADCKLAIAGFTSALRLNRDHVPAYAHRAEMRQQLGDLEGAMADCDQAIRRDPHYGFAYAIRGHVHLRQGERRKAIADCAEAIRLGIGRLDGATYLGGCPSWGKRIGRGIGGLRRRAEVVAQARRGLVLRAKVQMQMGLLDAAVEDASAAIDLVPAWNAPYAIRGNLHGLRGDTASALADLDEALRLEPADAHAHYNRGVAWFQQKEFAKSLEDLNEAERLGYRAAMLYFMRATVHLQQCRAGAGTTGPG